MNSEILYITRRLGFPSSFGMRSRLDDFLEQYPDGIYVETGIGAPIGWESAAVWFGGESERAAARFERMVAERNDVSRLFRTRVSGVLLLTFQFRMKKRSVTAVPVSGGTPPTPPPSPIDDWWGLKLTMPEGGTIILRKNGSPNAVSLEVSTDAVSWSAWELVGTNYSYTLQAGETLCIRNTSTVFSGFSSSLSDYYSFILSSETHASGSIMSLAVNDSNVLSMENYGYVFAYIFANQSNLMSMPELPATILSAYCYRSSFQYTGIKETKVLQAEVLNNYSCSRMFIGCSMLTEVSTRMTNVSALNCLYLWLQDVSAQGDFYCPAELTIPTGVNGIPSGWTRHDI